MVGKIIDPNVAANAYKANQNIGQNTAGNKDDQVSFSDFLKKTAHDAVDTMRKSEEMSAKAVTGEADITDVVQAVSAAELTLETVVAVRDRMVSAYQDIMSMPI